MGVLFSDEEFLDAFDVRAAAGKKTRKLGIEAAEVEAAGRFDARWRDESACGEGRNGADSKKNF